MHNPHRSRSQPGTVRLYDDTAVTNRYRLPLGLGIVIDGEYYTRAVFQTITTDTTRETFEWMLEAFQDARGAPPDVFIQDADIDMTSAADKVYSFATKRRCVWYLGRAEHIEKPRRGLGI